ncbi:hypothetical protein MTLP_11860 [Candidatus Methanoliparum sp. LAM-1]|nr:hypothetical protein MTLP_11860 [Candidatus Methanoliparum sp. LAM-1]
MKKAIVLGLCLALVVVSVPTTLAVSRSEIVDCIPIPFTPKPLKTVDWK